MTFPQLFIPILIAAASPAANTPATTAPATTRPAGIEFVGDTVPAVKLEFPLAGYRINALDPATKGFCNFIMSLPISGNSHSMSAWVWITSGPPMETKPPVSFHAHHGDTILFERAVSPTEMLVEFTATNGDKAARKEHSYWRELFANGRTYVINATAMDTEWKDVGPKLKACVDSFELSSDPAPGKVAFPQQGYRISLLDGVLPANAQGNLLGFGPSVPTVIVSIEPYAKTLKDYQAERKPLRMLDSKHKFKILTEKMPDENTLVTEYAEEFPAVKNQPQGGQLLSYEKVVLAHGQLYRASGLLDATDPKSLAQIKAWVDSLEPIPTLTPAPAK